MDNFTWHANFVDISYRGYGDRVFSFIAPCLWNWLIGSLPVSSEINGFQTFKGSMTHLQNIVGILKRNEDIVTRK